MAVLKPSKHGRDHLPGGEDPIPLPLGIAEHIKVFEDDENVTAGDGKFYFGCSRDFALLVLGDIEIDVSTASSSGIVQVQIHNVTQGVDMLSTRIQIDANETHSRTASTAVVIDAGNADVAHGDILRIDVDAAGSAARGLAVVLKFFTTPALNTLVGPIGPQGAQGNPGADGVDGANGADGATGPQGPQGDPGGITAWLGEWDSATSYVESDSVSWNGSSYAARQANSNVEPGVDTGWEDYWQLLAAGVEGSVAAEDANLIIAMEVFG